MQRLNNLNILIAGQALVSRTETVENYLRDKVKSLAVIAIANIYSPADIAKVKYYQRNKLLWQKPLKNIHFNKITWYYPVIFTLAFGVHLVSIFKAAKSFNKKFDIFIGIACFSTIVGLLLKRLGVVKHVVYYSIDYYPMPKNFEFSTIVVKLFSWADKLCAKKSDVVWHIIPKIAVAREKSTGLAPESYKKVTVPLCYGKEFLNPKPFSEIDRFTLGFVGVLARYQGLQMVIKAFPQLLKKFPQIKLKIVGTGPYEKRLKDIAKKVKCEEKISFYGFIKEETKVFDILSKVAVGIAPWTMSSSDKTKFADPGKAKLYAFCGLPTIMTKGSPVAGEIEKMKAGVVINYDIEEFIDAVVKLLKDEKILKEYRTNALSFARKYTSENVFQKAWEETFDFIPALRKISS